MTAVCFYFQVHQPYRLRRRLGKGGAAEIFDQKENRRILERVAERCYLPMNRLLLERIEETEGAFRCSFSLSGTVLSQLEDWAPEALDSFVELAHSGAVEFLCETGYHSLASLASPTEFAAQVEGHRARIEELFGQNPTTFRNTELILSNEIAGLVQGLGFDVLLGEGADGILRGRSPRRPYAIRGGEGLTVLLRDYLFSDDIAFRFSNREWEEYPLMADRFASWLHRAVPEDAFIGLFMDYETFGEHQWAETGVLEFMEHLPRFVLADERFRFATPREVAAEAPPRDRLDVLDVPEPRSWADAERDVSAWLGNVLQRSAHEALYALEQDVAARPELLETWRRLTTSDHVYYMCTKFRSDGDVHEYFTPYESPHDSYVVFMNALRELRSELHA